MEKKSKPKKEKNPMKTEGFGWRVSVSIVSFIVLLVFLVLWFFFQADAYTIYQNIAIVVAAILLFCGVMGGVWAPWGMKHAEDFECCEEGTERKTKNVKCKVKEGVQCNGTGGFFYFLGFLGAVVYYIGTAPSFWDAFLGFFKAIVWPAFLVHGLLLFMGA